MRLHLIIWRILQQAGVALLPGNGIAALDVSSWDCAHTSRYYCQRVKLKIRAIKTTLWVDTGAQTIWNFIPC